MEGEVVLISHFEQIRVMNKKASVNLPNSIFRQLSKGIKTDNNSKNIQQVAFAYNYLVAISFLYKYSNFVDIGNGSYIQNSDLKELLGYSKTTKSINRIIAKDGLLEQLGLIKTDKDYPVAHYFDKSDDVNDMPVWEFVMRSDVDEQHILYPELKKVVKNRNYEIRVPLFLTDSYDGNEYGTLYQFERTHEITIDEFLTFKEVARFSNSTFLLYAFLKSRCKGLPLNGCEIALYKIESEIGMDSNTFYRKLNELKDKKYINVYHGQWRAKRDDRFVPMIANKYYWKGVK
jgi:hypothetical protein